MQIANEFLFILVELASQPPLVPSFFITLHIQETLSARSLLLPPFLSVTNVSLLSLLCFCVPVCWMLNLLGRESERGLDVRSVTSIPERKEGGDRSNSNIKFSQDGKMDVGRNCTVSSLPSSLS